MRENGFTCIEPTSEAEVGWRQLIQQIYSMLLAGQESKSESADGKLGEARNFLGGIPMYIQKCQESVENAYKGFAFSGMTRKAMSRL